MPPLQTPRALDLDDLDRVIGGAAVLRGGSGNDVVYASNGAEEMVLAGAGDDEISTFEGADTVFGDTGNDSIRSGDGADLALGGEGNDLLLNTGGADTLSGGAGDDTLVSSGSGSVLDGGAGRDAINMAAGNSSAAGGAGDDTIVGSTGNDSVFWQVGDGNDSIRGGHGTDTLVLHGVTAEEVMRGLSALPGLLASDYRITLDGDTITIKPSGSVPNEMVLRIGGETLRLSEIETIRIAR